jgi:hypothetical protein
MIQDHDMTWTTVTLRPPIDVRAGEDVHTTMSPCGRVMLVTMPDRASLYRRTATGDYELNWTTRLEK